MGDGGSPEMEALTLEDWSHGEIPPQITVISLIRLPMAPILLNKRLAAVCGCTARSPEDCCSVGGRSNKEMQNTKDLPGKLKDDTLLP